MPRAYHPDPKSRTVILSLIGPKTNGRIVRAVRALDNAGANPLVLSPKKNSRPASDFFAFKGLFGGTNLGISISRAGTRTVILCGLLLGISPMKTGDLAAKLLFGLWRVTPRIASIPGPILVEDPLLLAYALRLRPGRKVVFDSRDLSHRLFENSPVWNATFGRAIAALLAAALPLCDKVFTVSEGLSGQIYEDFRVRAQVIRSVPDSEPLPPKALVEPLRRIVYMGRADSNRNVKNLVQSAKHLNKEISIHLYLVGHRREIIRLRWQSRGLGNINFHKLVSFNSIISTLSKFDMGFVALGHATTNISLALPNKFFEYIFAGLPVLVSQGSEMDRTLRQFPAGVAIDPSNPESIATALNALSAKRMDVLRAGVRDFQKTLSWREEEVKLLDIMEIHNL